MLDLLFKQEYKGRHARQESLAGQGKAPGMSLYAAARAHSLPIFENFYSGGITMKKSIQDFKAMDMVNYFEQVEQTTAAAAALKADLPMLILAKGFYEKNFSFAASAVKKAKISDRSKKIYLADIERYATALSYGRILVDTEGKTNKYRIEQPAVDITGKMPVIDSAVLSQLEYIINVVSFTGCLPQIVFVKTLSKKELENRLEKLLKTAVKNGYSFELPILKELETV